MSISHPLHVIAEDVQFYRDHGYFVYQQPLFPVEKAPAFAGLLRWLVGRFACG